MTVLTISPTGLRLVAFAREVATTSHLGVFRDDGAPYITHPEAVAAQVTAWGLDAWTIAAAWLHDTVEDTSLTLDDLADLGFPHDVVVAVDCLTIRDGEVHLNAVRRAAANPIACPIKDADRRHNSRPDQLTIYSPERRARRIAKCDAAGAVLVPALAEHRRRGTLRFAA